MLTGHAIAPTDLDLLQPDRRSPRGRPDGAGVPRGIRPPTRGGDALEHATTDCHAAATGQGDLDPAVDDPDREVAEPPDAREPARLGLLAGRFGLRVRPRRRTRSGGRRHPGRGRRSSASAPDRPTRGRTARCGAGRRRRSRRGGRSRVAPPCAGSDPRRRRCRSGCGRGARRGRRPADPAHLAGRQLDELEQRHEGRRRAVPGDRRSVAGNGAAAERGVGRHVSGNRTAPEPNGLPGPSNVAEGSTVRPPVRPALGSRPPPTPRSSRRTGRGDEPWAEPPRSEPRTSLRPMQVADGARQDARLGDRCVARRAGAVSGPKESRSASSRMNSEQTRAATPVTTPIRNVCATP